MLEVDHYTSDILLTCGRFILKLNEIFWLVTKLVLSQAMPNSTCHQADECPIHLVKKLLIAVAPHLWPLEENLEYQRDYLRGSKTPCFLLPLYDKRPIENSTVTLTYLTTILAASEPIPIQEPGNVTRNLFLAFVLQFV